MTPDLITRVHQALEQAESLAPDRLAAFLANLSESEPDVASEVQLRLGMSPRVGSTQINAPNSDLTVSRYQHAVSMTLNDAGVLLPESQTFGQDGILTNPERYEILAELGRGGMGVVYQARHTRTGRVVALKTMRLSGGRALELFKGEFRYLQGVSHPNLVQLYGLEADSLGRWLLTMEYVEGTDFRTYLLGSPAGVGLETRSVAEQNQGTDPTRSFVALEPMREDATLSYAPGDGIDQDITCDHPRVESTQLVSKPAQNLDKLRDAFAQLVLGVAALHTYQRVHRDLKPQNVRVATNGRVVILDFGLTAALDPSGEYLASALAGTAPYMAPEQGDLPPKISPGSDWYAVGVMLYEALTGTLPFTGDLRSILEQKKRGVAFKPSDLRPGIPADLEQLCLRLLNPDPTKRPLAGDVLAVFGGDVPVTQESRATGGVILLGREQQLEELQQAWIKCRAGGNGVVRLHGPSGVGKSALVAQFTESLRSEGVLVLAGRCYEHESVPFKALDPVVDELARYLHKLDASQIQEVLPADLAPLLRVFPVLERVHLFEHAAAGQSLPPDPQELRRQAFAGLRQLLTLLAQQAPLIIHIDDLQWGDIDSAYLLTDLIRPPEAPQILWLLAHRSEDADSPCLKSLAESLGRNGVTIQDLEVGPLNVDASRQLALSILGSDQADQAERIVQEGGGHPFFVSELARAFLAGIETGGELSLDGLIRSRVSRLPEGAQRLLEVIAVSGRPLNDLDAYRALEAESGDPRGHVSRLEAVNLLRGVGDAGAIELETYHDRVREAVLAGLDATTIRGHHSRLATVLEESGRGDQEELAIHFEGAGENEKAGGYYHRAGDEAVAAVAFDQAAGFYRKALSLKNLSSEQTHDLMTKQADALANAGRGAEAGPIYLAIAENVEGLERLELQRRAMEELFLSGNYEQAKEILTALLAVFGHQLPRGPRRAMLGLLWEVIRLRLRGPKFESRDAETIPPIKLWQVDVVYAAAFRLYTLNAMLGSRYFAIANRWALDIGEPRRVAKALASSATLFAWGKGQTMRELGQSWMQKAIDLSTELNDPQVHPFLTMKRGFLDWGLGRWVTGAAFLSEAEEQASVGRVGLAVFRTEISFIAQECLDMSGHWREYSERANRYVENFRQRGNLYGLQVHMVYSYLSFLCADKPEISLNFLENGQGICVW